MSTEHVGFKMRKQETNGSVSTFEGFGPLWCGGPHNIEALHAAAYVSSGLEALVERAKERVATETLARKGQTGFNGLVFAGELGETLKYLRNPFATGLKLAASIERKLSRNLAEPWKPGILAKRYDLRSSKSIPSELSSLALEYMYGLKPLVREVEEILDRLQNGFKQHAPRERCGAREVVTKEVRSSVPWNQSSWTSTVDVASTFSVEVSAGALYHFYHGYDANNRDWGVRLTDVPSALWQLQPSSFVVDWFWGVNSFIKAITPIAGLVTDAEWTTVYKTGATVISNKAWGNSSDAGYVLESGGSGATYLSTKEISRLPGPLVPTITRTRVSEGVKSLSLGQTEGLLALFTQKCEPLVREFAPIFHRGRR